MEANYDQEKIQTESFLFGLLLAAILAFLISEVAKRVVGERTEMGQGESAVGAAAAKAPMSESTLAVPAPIKVNDAQKTALDTIPRDSFDSSMNLSSPSPRSGQEPEGCVFLEDYSTAEEVEEDQSTDDGDPPQADPVDAPRFPYLRVRNLVVGSSPSRLYPNARSSQVFDGPVCECKAQIALRVKGNEDPHFSRLFEGRARRLDVQIQMRFKRAPQGILYLGGELPQRMQLGLVTKGLCKAILSVLNKLSSTVHASFGDPVANELPHIVFPLWTAATKMRIIRSGQPVPPLGEEIEETAEQIKERVKKAANAPGDLGPGDTLVFNINSMYIDMVRWKCTNLGALGELSLEMFWDTMPLHLVLYDLDGGFAGKAPKTHSLDMRREYFAFEIKNTYYNRTGDDPVVIYPEEKSKFEVGDTAQETSGENRPAESDDDDDCVVVAAEDSSPRAAERPGESKAEDDEVHVAATAGKGGFLGRNRQRDEDEAALRNLCASNLYVVAWTECRNHKGNSSARLLVSRRDGVGPVVVVDRDKFFHPLAPSDLALATEQLLSGDLQPKRVHEWEALRTRLNFALAASERVTLPIKWFHHHNSSKLPRLPQSDSRDAARVVIPSKFLDNAKLLFECSVIRVHWETLWNEEWCVVMEGKQDREMYLMFFQVGGKTPEILLKARDLLSITEVPNTARDASSSNEDLLAFFNLFPSLELETLTNVLLVGLGSQEQCSRLGKLLAASQSGAKQAKESSSTAEQFLTSDLTTLALSQEKYRWGTTKRTVLNSRRILLAFSSADRATDSIVFGSSGSNTRCGFLSSSGASAIAAVPSSLLQCDLSASPSGGSVMELRKRLANSSAAKPWELTAMLLRSALALNDQDQSRNAQIQFFDQAARLRTLELHSWARVMTEEEKMCFALNLYHALRLHAKFLVGQPTSLLGWAMFNSRMCYVVGRGSNAMVFSLAEIEHCVIRKPMSLARTIISTQYPCTPYTALLELRNKETRLNFALNYGTQSSPSRIIVFHSPTMIDKMLDVAAALYLAEMLKPDFAKKAIGIPQLLVWYGRDFFPADFKDINNKTIGRAILEFVGDKQREQLTPLVQRSELVFKTTSFKWASLARQTELTVE